MKKFIHLNVKSGYSLLNSIAKPEEIIQTVKEFDIKTVALTDLNNMHDAYHFEQNCKKEGVKNIIGVTFCIKYNDNEFGNIVLLAKDTKGYKNLVCLSTIANKGEEHTGKKGFAYLDFSILKEYADGLFCLTGGTSGIFYKYWLDNNFEEIERYLADFKDIYHEDLYFEFQNHKIDDEKKFILDQRIYNLLASLQIEPVATNDVYYIKKEHAYHRALAVNMNSNPIGIQYYSSYVDYNDEWYLKSPEEMEDLFKDFLDLYPNILSNTVEIADQCNAQVPIEKALPEFPIPKGFTEETYLRFLCEEGFKERFDGRTDIDIDVYRKRLDYEFDVIKKMGFMAYHIITADFIQWAKDDKVYQHPERYFPKEYFPDYSKLPEMVWKKDFEILVGPGRGSAAGSLLCYCLKITNLDPIQDGLLFERFLNVERVSMPDIDVDFPNAHRYDVVEYVQAKYGFEKVCQIATFQTLGVKSIIKSLGKTLGLSYADTDAMTKKIPNKELVEEENEDGVIQLVEKDIKLLSQVEKIDYFQELIEKDSNIKKLFEMGKILEGLPASTGKHAAGVIIGRQNLMNYMPLMEVEGVMVSQFEKKASESIGMLKMDFLGLQTLDILAETLKLIQMTYGKKINLDEIPRNDYATFANIFQTGNTGKVFQFESQGMKNLLKRMKPTCLADLCAANAAYRPGPLQFIDDFIEGRNHPEKVKYPTKEYELIAKETKGILFYQEQIMQIVQAMAGFTLGQADILRRGIGKKEKKYIDDGRKRFIEGCLKLGTADEETAKYIYSTIEKFANYGFNKSHSDAYGYVAYLCGYLKEHYPECFMAANCTISSNDVKRLAPCLAEAQRMGIKILPPDVRYSKNFFTLESENKQLSIRFSLAAIRSIRNESAEEFMNSKDKSTFYSFVKGLPFKSITSKTLTHLIYSGALDYLGTRKTLIEALPEIMSRVKYELTMEKAHIPTIVPMMPYILKDKYEYSTLEKLKKEQDSIQIVLSGHPVSSIRNLTNIYNTISDLETEFQEKLTNPEQSNFDEKLPITLVGIINDYHQRITKKGDKMATFNISDEYGSLKAVVFQRDYARLESELNNIEEIVPVIIEGRIQGNEDERQFIVTNIKQIQHVSYTLYISLNKDNENLVYQEMKKNNGIASVVLIDTKKHTVKTLPFSVDISNELLQTLKNLHVNTIVKK